VVDRLTVFRPSFRYINYYIPFFSWVRQYKWSWLLGDVVAGLSMASFYIPMALSYASNLGHVPPINGLYAFVFQPIIYALLGSCPVMVVGPEAAGSLLVGNVVRTSVEKGHSDDDDGRLNAQIAGVVTVMAGGIIFVGGVTRLGFLDNVLSRPLLRGFISAVGFLIFVDQLIMETGLEERARSAKVSHGTTFEKMEFLFNNIWHSHGLTAAVAGISFSTILLGR
jgi:MFS superfamily sulfate permease-like transporter